MKEFKFSNTFKEVFQTDKIVDGDSREKLLPSAGAEQGGLNN